MQWLLFAACTSGSDSGDDPSDSADPGVHGELSITIPDGAVYKTSVPMDDGTLLAVRATWNPLTAERYAGERTTLLLARGSLSAGAFLEPQETGPWSRMGAVLVQVILPGGFSDGQVSTGEFDYRGVHSQDAFGAALEWTAGRRPDIDGKYIADIIPDASPEIGLVGMSAGVNLAFGALARDPSGLDFVKWMVAWEGPYTDQFLDVELMSYDFEMNPTYDLGSCGNTSCPFATEPDRIQFDPAGHSFTEDPLGAQEIDLDGVLYVDEDGDGHYAPDEFSWHMLSAPGPDGELACAPSLDLAQVIDAQSDRLFADSARPSWLPPTDWLEAYWATRDASVILPSLAAARPDLRIIVAGSQTDHIYKAVPDHPHVVALTHYLQDIGFEFVRLNPDAAYMGAALDADPSGLPDNDAGTAPTWPDTPDWLEPEGSRLPFDYFVPPSAALELDDRVHAGNWSPNLDRTLVAVPKIL